MMNKLSGCNFKTKYLQWSAPGSEICSWCFLSYSGKCGVASWSVCFGGIWNKICKFPLSPLLATFIMLPKIMHLNSFREGGIAKLPIPMGCLSEILFKEGWRPQLLWLLIFFSWRLRESLAPLTHVKRFFGKFCRMTVG